METNSTTGSPTANKIPLPDIPQTSSASQFYWLVRNLTVWTGQWASRHKLFFAVIFLVSTLGILLCRAWFHEPVLRLRIFFFPLSLLVLALLIASSLFQRKKVLFGLVTGVVAVGSIIGMAATHGGIWEYLTLYYHYRQLPRESLTVLPTTAHERIQPLNSIRVLAGEAMTDVEQVSAPAFVRVGDEYRWTMGVEPTYPLPRLTGRIEELIHVSATAPSPNFSQKNRSAVEFRLGQQLFLGKNIRNSVIKRFGLWHYLNYEPADMKYVKNEKGEWVQMVTLVKWQGFFMPRPVFGGLVIVEQDSDTGVEDWLNMLIGSGKWISPEKVKDYPWLVGQNLLPDRVTRFSAQSFRFKNGFLAPFPGYHKGDIRIPDLPGDQNDQPFTAYFNFPEGGKLYHYFALEPFKSDKQGLSTSVFIPADGTGEVRFYAHHEHEEALTGVSAIVPKVMESRKNYDWNRNSAAEQRPFIRRIDGEIHFFWLTTVVTYKESQEDGYEVPDGAFIAGSAPDITLTDALFKTVVWVDAREPETWETQLKEELSEIWQSK